MTTWNGTDIVPTNFKYFVGRPGAFAKRGANFNVQNCDFYLSIGTRLPFMVTGYNKTDFARNAYKVMVDIDKEELNKHSDIIDELVHADAFEFLDLINKKIPDDYSSSSKWLKTCVDLNKKYPLTQRLFKDQNEWVYSYHFIDELSKNSNSNVNIITDMGLSFVGTHMGFNVKDGQNIFTNSGHAPMGWGLPAAIGAYYNDTKRKTICLTGEGGFMMNIQELATVMHNKIPLVIFIYNNGGYQTIKDTQILGFQGRLMGCNEDTGLSFPSFEQIAASFGMKYLLLKNNSEVEKNLSNIIDENNPILVELMIDPEQQHVPKSINKRTNDGKTIPSKFEDLYPFLPSKEVQNNLI